MLPQGARRVKSSTLCPLRLRSAVIAYPRGRLITTSAGGCNYAPDPELNDARKRAAFDSPGQGDRGERRRRNAAAAGRSRGRGTGSAPRRGRGGDGERGDGAARAA